MNGLEITEVIHAGPADQAGFNPGDVLIALGGLRIDQTGMSRRLERFNAGETVSVAVFRDDELKEFDVTLAEGIKHTCILRFNNESGDEAVDRRKSWIGN